MFRASQKTSFIICAYSFSSMILLKSNLCTFMPHLVLFEFLISFYIVTNIPNKTH